MTDDVLQTAQWLVSGRLASYAVDEKSVVAMAKKLLEALEALEASQDALNETLAKSAEALLSEKKRCADKAMVAGMEDS